MGHGSPTNAIEDNEFSRAWADAARSLPRPRAILCISAHWETAGTRVTAMKAPKTIHYELGRELQGLCSQGILILGSGNIVHNLGRIVWQDQPYDWAKVTLGSICMRSLRIG